MKPTQKQHNDFLAHEPVPGVRYEHNEFVRVVAGSNAGKSGSLISIEELGEDPLFLIELENGADAYVRQSEIAGERL